MSSIQLLSAKSYMSYVLHCHQKSTVDDIDMLGRSSFVQFYPVLISMDDIDILGRCRFIHRQRPFLQARLSQVVTDEQFEYDADINDDFICCKRLSFTMKVKVCAIMKVHVETIMMIFIRQ